MSGSGSIFLEFNLPNPATWFYFALLLAIGLFFKFSRFLSIRNLDVLTLFLLVPGLLLRLEAVGPGTAAEPGPNQASVSPEDTGAGPRPAGQLLWFAYLWLVCGSAFFFLRCLLDLALVRRPALSPNLNLAGLAWLGGAFFVCLAAVAFRYPTDRPDRVGRASAVLDVAQQRVESLVVPEALGLSDGHPGKHFWVTRGLAIACHLAIVVALIVIGYRHFQDVTAGMAAGTFYLLLPYTAYHVGQFHHVWPTALLLWAVAFYRSPVTAGLLLGLAAGSAYFPVLLLPIWLSFYWRRGGGRFLGAFVLAAGLSLAVVALALWWEGQLFSSWHTVLRLSDWQPWLAPTTEGFWSRIPWAWAYRVPVFIAFLAFLVTTAFWPAPKNLAHVLALSAAVLIGIQFWYADKGGLYVLWYLPILLLLVFRPNLADRQPPPIHPETDRLIRWRRSLGRLLGRGLAALRGAPLGVAGGEVHR